MNGYDGVLLETSTWRGECPGDQRSTVRFNEPESMCFVGRIALPTRLLSHVAR